MQAIIFNLISTTLLTIYIYRIKTETNEEITELRETIDLLDEMMSLHLKNKDTKYKQENEILRQSINKFDEIISSSIN